MTECLSEEKRVYSTVERLVVIYAADDVAPVSISSPFSFTTLTSASLPPPFHFPNTKRIHSRNMLPCFALPYPILSTTSPFDSTLSLFIRHLPSNHSRPQRTHKRAMTTTPKYSGSETDLVLVCIPLKYEGIKRICTIRETTGDATGDEGTMGVRGPLILPPALELSTYTGRYGGRIYPDTDDRNLVSDWSADGIPTPGLCHQPFRNLCFAITAWISDRDSIDHDINLDLGHDYDSPLDLDESGTYVFWYGRSIDLPFYRTSFLSFLSVNTAS